MPLTLEPFLVILASLAAAAVTELVSWVLVYRNSSFRRLKEELDRSCKKLEAIKQISGGGAAVAASKPGKSNKKEKRLEDNMKSSTKEMGAVRFRLNAIMAVFMMVVFQLVSARWDGTVVAKLPFSPPGLLQGITHRGLAGEDPTDCSAAFVFGMSFMYFKQNLGKALGFSLSRAANRALMANNPMANLDAAATKYK